MKIFKRELLIYLAVLACMALVWHNSSLLERMGKIHTIANPFHPLEWAMVGYLVLWIPRGIYVGIKKLIKRKNDDNPSDTI